MPSFKSNKGLLTRADRLGTDHPRVPSTVSSSDILPDRS